MYYNTSYTNAIGRNSPTYYGTQAPAFTEEEKRQQKAMEGIQVMLGGVGLFAGMFIAFYAYDKLFVKGKKK